MTSQCKILYPVDVEGLTFSLWEDAGTGMIDQSLATVHESTNDGYYVDKGTTTAGYGNLLDRLETLLNTGLNTYEITANGTDFGRADFKLKISDIGMLGYDFELRVTETSGSILEILGADNADDLVSVSGVIEFANHYKGCWMLPKERQWHDYRKYPQMVAGITSTSVNTVHVRERNKSDYRHFEMMAVPAVLAYEGRTVYQGLCDEVPGVALLDSNISFETFWREGISQGQPFRFYYELDDSVIEQTLAGRSECIVKAENIMKNPSDFVEEKYKEHGIDYVDIAFDATVKEDLPPGAALPIPSFTMVDGVADREVDVDASASTVTGSATYTWDWGSADPDTTGSTDSNIYATAAVYTITLTIVDDNGTASLTQDYTANVGPGAAFVSVDTDLEYAVDASTTTNDAAISTYFWDWDDGTTTTTASATHTHCYAAAGTYDPVLTVTDVLGDTDTATENVVISFTPATIGAPGTSLTYTHIWRAFEAADVSGDVSTIANTGTTGSDLTATGTAMPTKSATGVGSVVFDGVANVMMSGTAAEYEFLTDVSTDWTIQMVVFMDSALGSGTTHWMGTTDGTTRGITLQCAAGTPRWYGYGSGSDNTPLGGLVFDDTWQVVVLRFDKSASDAHRWFVISTGFMYYKDSNWSWGPEAGSPDFAFSLGAINGANFTDFKVRDLRIAKEVGNLYSDAILYQNWALVNGLLD